VKIRKTICFSIIIQRINSLNTELQEPAPKEKLIIPSFIFSPKENQHNAHNLKNHSSSQPSQFQFSFFFFNRVKSSKEGLGEMYNYVE